MLCFVLINSGVFVCFLFLTFSVFGSSLGFGCLVRGHFLNYSAPCDWNTLPSEVGCVCVRVCVRACVCVCAYVHASVTACVCTCARARVFVYA